MAFLRILRILVALPLLALTACNASMGERMGRAVTSLEGFQKSESPIPSAVFANAKGVAVIRETNAALVIGGSGGEGVFVKRSGMGWSAPVAIDAAGATIGLQAGGQTRDIVLVMNTEDEVSKFLDDGLYGLAEMSAVAGPSRVDPANSAGNLPATYYYLRSEGIFGGVLVGGVTFRVADKVNRGMYGDDHSLEDILKGKVRAPAGSSVLWQMLN